MKKLIAETLVLVGIKEHLPKGCKATYPEWYGDFIAGVEDYQKVYQIAHPSVWAHHDAMGLHDLREVVLLRRKKRIILSLWSKRPFKETKKKNDTPE